MFGKFGRISYSPCTKVAEFAERLDAGQLCGTRCATCGFTTFPPRADCPRCLSDEFEFVEYSGKGTLLTYSVITAGPAGFEDQIPYTIGVVDLEEGGRLLAWFDKSIAVESIEMGMSLVVEVERLETPDGERLNYKLNK